MSLPPPPPSLPLWPLEIPYGLLFSLSGTGVKWDKHHRFAYYQGATLPPALTPYLAPPWSWAWHQARLAPGFDATIPSAPPLWVPRPHQAQAITALDVAFRASLPGFVVADDVGVGKTLVATTWLQRQISRASSSSPPWILIVTTTSALPHWRRTLRHTGVTSPNLLLLNYEQLGKILSPAPTLSTRAKGRAKRLATKGKIPKFSFIVFDEAHRGRNPSTATSIAMRRLARASAFTLWLSATIGRHPAELSYLAPLFSTLTGSQVPGDSLASFGQWCIDQHLGLKRGAFGSFVRADLDDPSRTPETQAGLARTQQLLFSPQAPYPAVAIRRLPTDIAAWPALERNLMPVSVSPSAATLLDATLAPILRAELQAGPPHQRTSSSAAASLVRLLRLRQAFSLARLDTTVDQILDFLDSGKQVAVSVAFLATVDLLRERLSAHHVTSTVITGAVTGAAREAARQAFQTGRAPVCLFTIEEAISLHQGEAGGNDVGRIMLVHDVRWSPLQMTQIEGRCHRDGALAPVFWQYAEHTLEAKLVATVLAGVSSMKSMLGDETATLDVLRDQVFQAAQSLALPH